jgi:hypothetical protein
MTPLLPLLAAVMSPLALGQEITIHEGWLLQPQPGTFYANGIGSPTVAYDEAADQWVMFFETQFGGADNDCRVGRWGVGRATSPDGLSWTIDPNMVIEPDPATYYDCVVAHPTVLYDGTTWHIWFKAHQQNTACVDTGVPEPAWGCGAVTGVGYASSTDGRQFTVSDAPIINLSAFGFPTVTRVDGTYRMLLAFSNERNQIFELWQSVSTDDGATWSTPQFVIGPGFSDWVEDEIYNPELVCDEAAVGGPFILYAGGRDTEPSPGGPPRLQTAGMGRAFSTDAVTWAWDGTEALIEWNLAPPPPALPDRDWRHWDVVRTGEHFLFFFSQKDDQDRNRIGLAYTYPDQQTTLDEGAISNRICREPFVPGDETDTPVDTDTDGPIIETELPVDTDDTDETDSPDTDDGDDDKPCGCRTTAPASGLLLLLPLLWVRRRR